MIIKHSSVFLTIVVLMMFTNLAIAENQNTVEKKQSTSITSSTQQTSQHSDYSIIKEEKKSEQPEPNKSSKPNMADYCRKHTC